MIRHLQDPHMRYSLVAGTTSLCLQTWRNDAVPRSNFLQKPTRTAQIRKHYYKITVVNQAKGDSFEHWLVMYLLKYWFRIIFQQKKCSFKLCICITFTFMHLADAFIQSDLQYNKVIHFLSVCVCPGNWTHNLCAANAMLYHWATEKLMQGEVQCFWTQDWNKCVKRLTSLCETRNTVWMFCSPMSWL